MNSQYTLCGISLIWLSEDKKRDHILKVKMVLSNELNMNLHLINEHYRNINPFMNKKAPLISCRETYDGGWMDSREIDKDSFKVSKDWDNRKIACSEELSGVYLCDTKEELIDLIDYLMANVDG